MSLKNKLQIIVITYNREKALRRTLEQLLDEKSPVRDITIHVLDNKSQDSTRAITEEFSAKHANLHYVCNKYNDDCDYFPMDKEQYIGFKFTIDGRDHLGWMKIILEERQGDYYVRPIESAIQK